MELLDSLLVVAVFLALVQVLLQDFLASALVEVALAAPLQLAFLVFSPSWLASLATEGAPNCSD